MWTDLGTALTYLVLRGAQVLIIVFALLVFVSGFYN